MQLKFKIITLEKTVYEAEVDAVTIPTTDGEITVLARHTPLVAVLKPGSMLVKKDKQDLLLSVSSGFVEVRQDSQVIILADTAERAEDLDIARAEEARARVEKMMQEKEKIDDVAFARMQTQLEKELARVRVGKRYRRR